MANRNSFLTHGVFATLFLFFTCACLSQTDSLTHKISPRLQGKLNAVSSSENIFLIIASREKDVNRLKQHYHTGVKKIHTSGELIYYSVTTSVSEFLTRILHDPSLVFAEDGSRKPREELQIQNLDLALNRINLVHRKFPVLNGDNLVVSVKENYPDTADIDFRGRFRNTALSSSILSSHASAMATMIAGGGNSWHLGKGAAWGSTITSSNFANLLPDGDAIYQQQNISVQNHSYGTGIENYYGADASAYDESAISNASLLHVFSAGNSGNEAAPSGVYSGITGFANLTGSFKMAKNIITAGATDSFGVTEILSSRGPAYDGRIKPELVAFGEDGSSGAAALVSGVSLLLQKQYQLQTGFLPSNALLKAILLNSADDGGNPGPDFKYGYGSLNADKAILTLQTGRYGSGSVSQGDMQSFALAIPAGIKRLKLTLVWNDPPATPNTPRALVNDLDLELVETSSGTSWKPWVLNPFPHPDSLNKTAVRNRDSLNNVEQVTLDFPMAGDYQIRVSGFSVTGASQSFYLAYQFDSSDLFEWVFPTYDDFIFPQSVNTIRWTSSLAAASGTLDYSIDNGTNWLPVISNTDLSTGYYHWQAPSHSGPALLRMTSGSRSFVSDTFIMAPRILTGVGFVCPDSFLVYWNKLPGVNTYRFYRLGNKYLVPAGTTSDSFLVLSRVSNPSLHFAVAPVFMHREGVKSYTLNYTTQGVECFIRSFFSSLQNNSVSLTLSLGTLYSIQNIVLEKLSVSGFTAIQQHTPVSTLQILFTDNGLQKGINSYRVRLELAGGRVIYSGIESVYYFPDSEFIIYPNPVQQNQVIRVLSKDPLIPTTVEVFSSSGQKLAGLKITESVTEISSGRFGRGLYLFRFIRTGEKEVVMKLLIQ